jgi:homospermidine synthase
MDNQSPEWISSSIQLPKTVMLLGYGAIGKCFAEMLLQSHPKANLIVADLFDIKDPRFKFLKFKVTRENIPELLKHLEKGDILVDLSINIDFTDIWQLCIKAGIMYLNTATEEWGDSEDPTAFPATTEEMYLTSIGFLHDEVEQMESWDTQKGTTTVLEHGMNPGLVSHFSKKGLIDAAKFFLTQKDNTSYSDLDFKLIDKFSKEKNYPKLAQALGLHTIHCSEVDNQWVNPPLKDTRTKFYNTWSCRGFFTEALIPIQVARGSHEDKDGEEFPRVRDGSCIMSWAPSYLYRAKSWVPFQNTEGLLIPQGESLTIRDFFSDPETGYCPSQYFVYDANPYSRDFIENMPIETTLQTCDPEYEVIDPTKYDLHGYDKVGALLIFKKNRGWWAGTIMDEFDASTIFAHKFGPTAIQVAAGCYAGFLWMCKNPNAGCKWPDSLDTDFILEMAKGFLGRIYSNYVDLSKTHLKDCEKFEHFFDEKIR